MFSPNKHALVGVALKHSKAQTIVEFAAIPFTFLLGANMLLAGAGLGTYAALKVFRKKKFAHLPGEHEPPGIAGNSEQKLSSIKSILIPFEVLYLSMLISFFCVIPPGGITSGKASLVEGLLPITLFLAWFIPVTFVVFFVFTWIVASVIVAQEPDSGDGART